MNKAYADFFFDKFIFYLRFTKLIRENNIIQKQDVIKPIYFLFML